MVAHSVTLLDHRDMVTAAAILAVQHAAYAVEAALIDYPALPPLRETAQTIRNSDEQFLGCREDGRLLGVLSFELLRERLHICRLAVHPDFVRRGVAGALLVSAENLTDRLTITVSTAERNTPAIALYTKHGYAITQHITTPDGLPLVLLTKTR
ncbi:MAG: GNAT family N-acetyltransferase [Anaerolineae bacterium]|nr:GNAT family N-acetyltransferase [Anaerolineae bacterium]MCO5190183.1 GNAT family N-acetyltransferase [Anaerolineae bacterium]MCO5191931.1 GNAT family N-acetyltransferase [Anaerolineae bacterium]